MEGRCGRGALEHRSHTRVRLEEWAEFERGTARVDDGVEKGGRERLFLRRADDAAVEQAVPVGALLVDRVRHELVTLWADPHGFARS